MNDKNGLISSPWARFRANAGSSGKSAFPGPENDVIIWELDVGEISSEPVIGQDGIIYLPLKTEELVSISQNGEILWRQPLIGFRKKPLRGITTPAVRSDGSLIVAALRKVVCLESNGEQRWEKTIDGLPSAPNISPGGTIYISAWSIDWAGIYVISPDGDSTGLDDPKLTANWRAGRFVGVSPPALDQKGNVYVPFRENRTHPEAYTWDPIDEVEEEYYYECAIFDPMGKKGRRFVAGTRTFVYPTTVSINGKGWVHYISASWPGLVCFTFEDLITDKKDANKNCQWNWDKFRDSDSKDNYGPAYDHKASGYAGLDENNQVWFRLSKNLIPTNKILKVDTSKIETKNSMKWEVFALSATIKADPVIDSNNLAYIGTTDGKIYVFDSKGKQIRIIDIVHPVKALAIGSNASLIVTTKNNKIILIR